MLSRIFNYIVYCANNNRIHSYKKKIKGTNYNLGHETIIMYPENISIGKGTYINGGHIFASANAHISIGCDCSISYNVHIRTQSHNYLCKASTIRSQGLFEKDIVINDDCWIGYGAQILPGVTIAKGCVIGAGAVVTKDTIEYGVYVGVPAKLLKYRE